MSTQLVDNSPPNGDYVRYIDQLMQRSHAAAVQKAQAEHGTQTLQQSAAATLPAVPGQTQGPPELAELMRRVFKKSMPVASDKSKSMPVVAVWWLWVAVALIVAGVFFPMGIGWIAIIAFVLWRVSKAASGVKGRKS